jgi:hypothetical protein
MPTVSTDTRYDEYYYTVNLQVSDEIKDIIVRNHVEPNYIRDIDDLFAGKRNWKKVGQSFETASKALVAIGGIISFAAGFFNEYYLSFIAGAISTISLATLQFSSFGYKESKKQSIELNTNLKRLKIEEVPVNDRNTDETMVARSSYAQQSVRPSQNQQYYYQSQDVINALQNQLATDHSEFSKEIASLRAENETLKKASEKENAKQDTKEDTKEITLSNEVADDIKSKDEGKQTIYKSGKLELARTSSGEYTFNIHRSEDEEVKQ